MTETKKQKHLTFLTEGLTQSEIKFLEEVEKLYFTGAKIDIELFKNAFTNSGIKKGSKQAEKCSHAWDYWTFLKRPAYRESYKTPVKLSSLFEVSEHGRTTLYNPEHKKVKGTYTGKDLNLLNHLSIYFEITRENDLYLQYDQIIGSRFVAIIDNDIEFK